MIVLATAVFNPNTLDVASVMGSLDKFIQSFNKIFPVLGPAIILLSLAMGRIYYGSWSSLWSEMQNGIHDLTSEQNLAATIPHTLPTSRSQQP